MLALISRRIILDAETLKTLMPLVTFIFGILSAPLVEHLKSIYQDRKLIRCMKEEFHDEICEIKSRIEKMSTALNTLNNIKEKTYEGGGALRYIPRETLMLFLEKSLISNYTKIPPQMRNTLKSIATQINAINSFSNNLKELQSSDETIDEIIKNQKHFIYTACCLRYSMQFYLKPKTKKHYKEITDQQMIEDQLSEIGITISYKDIIITKSLSFK
ncbi:hypothetical protein [Cellvibrio sp. QJXJ]|uniref:hypothetical protein n=1 Tax=Cellvibrio sp. QJXJ TaxID=2964606 RepID=UPI0021C3E8CA|nr:hypothetical protein [Cellvibrio sp. QJXJ]UUA74152.1 hypothetical protein NNX04_06835 [Cellvibrio sp. QJXJ]